MSGQGARGGARCDGKQLRQAPANESSWHSNLSRSLISPCLLCPAKFRALTNILLAPFSFLWAPTIFVLLTDNTQTCACLSVCMKALVTFRSIEFNCFKSLSGDYGIVYMDLFIIDRKTKYKADRSWSKRGCISVTKLI